MMKDLEMVSIEEGREIVLKNIHPLEAEQVSLVDAVGRVAAEDLTSDIDITPFAHAAMDGFALKAAQIEGATVDAPVKLKVVAEIPAGSTYEGDLAHDECVRIMTGAPVPGLRRFGRQIRAGRLRRRRWPCGILRCVHGTYGAAQQRP